MTMVRFTISLALPHQARVILLQELKANFSSILDCIIIIIIIIIIIVVVVVVVVVVVLKPTGCSEEKRFKEALLEISSSCPVPNLMVSKSSRTPV
jgi:flagellar basal body-associated protein FliL